MSKKNNINIQENNNKNDEIETEAQTIKKMKPKSSFWGHSLCGLFIFCVNIIIILCVFLFTSFGQRTLIQFADKLSDDLSIESVSGGLQNGLELNNIIFKNDIVDVNIKKINLELNLICLLSSKVCVDKLQIADPNIILYKLPKNKKSHHSSTIKLPFDIQAKNLKISNLHFKFNELSVDLGSFQGGANAFKNQTINLLPIELNQVKIILNKKDTLNTKITPHKIDWESLQQKLNNPILKNLDFLKLPFNINVMQLSGKDWELIDNRKKIHIQQFVTQGVINTKQIELKTLELQSDLVNANAQGIIN